MNERTKSDAAVKEPVYITLTDETDFEKALSEAIGEGLACISNIVAPVLRAYLDDAVTCEIGRMKSRSTIKDVETLEKGLERMFGFGAKVFENKILEALHTKLSLNMETQQDVSFLEAVKEAKSAFDSRKCKNKKSQIRGNRAYTKSRNVSKS